MEWHKSDVQGLAVIDAELDGYQPAQYEIIRQVIYATADFEYKDLIQFSDQAIEKGTAAIAARTSIVVDVASVQITVAPILQSTFANGVYACTGVITRPQRYKSQAAWGMETLAQRYPSGIFVVGESQSALETLVNLMTSQVIAPSLVIATPSEFVNVGIAKSQLQRSSIPYILINGQKGGAMVAAKILNALVLLAWEVYDIKDDL
ncbi:precorrin isomerase [Synechococcus sp. PCC 7502]|uniref:precorrin-8X methylmutase n=1 Tax=Synechococcus sp. PCC 7502 TaxID=1173263 RepID=UPI00029FE84B|nr:precorrin-8X methylmutase [Synechococcus sp. PCC 7502]AFY73463.1 precorrin isomerase [Synechococcus sp. PCC 7502]